MGRYVKLTYPNCKYVLQNYTLDNTYGMIDIGEPLEICPNCKNILIRKNIKEINMMSKFDYFRMYTCCVISGIFFSLFIMPILILPFITFFIKKNNLLIIILYIAIAISSSYIYIVRSHSCIKRQKRESEQRLENSEYRKLIEEIFDLK